VGFHELGTTDRKLICRRKLQNERETSRKGNPNRPQAEKVVKHCRVWAHRAIYLTRPRKENLFSLVQKVQGDRGADRTA
jgi:hypothetical protein